MTLYPFEDGEWNAVNCGLGASHFLQEGYLYKCPLPEMIAMFDEKFGTHIYRPGAGIDIYKTDNPWDILYDLEKPCYLCYHCAVKRKEVIDWHTGDIKKEDWLVPHRYEYESKKNTEIIRVLNRSVQEKSIVVEQRDKILQEQSETIKSQHQSIREKSAVIEQRDKTLREQSEIIESQYQSIREKSAVIEQRDKVLRNQQIHLYELNETLEITISKLTDIKKSTCWQITKPLRVAKDFFMNRIKNILPERND
jgi:hypothetical protein